MHPLVRTAAVVLTSTAATAALAVVAVPASAGPPEVVTIDRTFVNGFLSGECGVEVTQHLYGSYSTVRRGDRTITNYRFRSTLTAGENVVRSRAFGPSIEVVDPDGTHTVTQLGVTMRNLPGSGTAGPFAGRSVMTYVVDEDGEVVETEGQQSGLRQDLAELCGALTA